MVPRNLLLGIFVISTIILASFTISEYSQIASQSAELRSASSQAVSITYFTAPRAIFPVTCCPTLPANFAVGSYGFNVTIASGPFISGGGRIGSAQTINWDGAFIAFEVYNPLPVVYPPNPPPPKTEWANFSFGATFFSMGVPSPPSASLFSGEVVMNWFTYSSLLYLNVTTS